QERHRFAPGDPDDRGVRVHLGDRRQQCRGAEDVAHRVQLHDQHLLFEPIVAIAGAERALTLVPDTGPIAEEEPAVRRDFTVTADVAWLMNRKKSRHDGRPAAPAACRSATNPDVDSPGIRSTMCIVPPFLRTVLLSMQSAPYSELLTWTSGFSS